MKRADNYQLALFAPAETIGGGNSKTTKPKGGDKMKTDKKPETKSEAKIDAKPAPKTEKKPEAVKTAKTEAPKPKAEAKPAPTVEKTAKAKKSEAKPTKPTKADEAPAVAPKIAKPSDGVAILADTDEVKSEAAKPAAKPTTAPKVAPTKAVNLPAVEKWEALRKRHADELAAFYKAHPVKGEAIANPIGVEIPAAALGEFCALRVRQSREFRRRLDYSPVEAFDYFLEQNHGDAQAALFAMGITTTKENAEAGNLPQYSRQFRAVLKARQAQAEKKDEKPTAPTK